MITVFGDESHDSKNERVFVVAGIGGTQQEWDEVEPLWNERHKGIPFHATDCESGHGSYKGINRNVNLKLYEDSIKIIANSKLLGFAAVLDLAIQREFFPNVLEDFPYFFCFSSVIGYFSGVAKQYIPQEKKVKFIFHRNAEIEPPIEPLYKFMSGSAAAKHIYENLDELAFSPMESNIGLQVADIIAREAMKHYDNIILNRSEYKVRKSMSALLDVNRFTFTVYGRKYFEKYSQNFEELEQKSGIYYNEFVKWLQDNKLQDNSFNRHRYLNHIDKVKNPTFYPFGY